MSEGNDRSGDTIIRIGLFIFGLALFVGMLVVLNNSDSWAATPRSLLLGAIIAGAFVAVMLGSDAFGKGSRFRITPKRHGLPITGEAPPAVAFDPATGPTEPVRLRGNSKWWAGVLIVAGTASVLLFLAGRSALAAAGHDLPSAEALVALGAAVLFGLVAVRAAVGLISAPGAVVITNGHIRLGASLGYWPPLRIVRSNLRAVGGDGSLVLATSDRVFETSNMLFSAKSPTDLVTAAWPEHKPEAQHPDEAGEHVFTLTGSSGRLPDQAKRTAEGVLKRRRVRTFVVAVVGLVGLIVVVSWYVVQRIDNDRLLREGVVVQGTVVDTKDGKLFIPGLAEVEFTIKSARYTGVVASGPFSDFRVDLVGARIALRVDPDDPSNVRTLGERNYSPPIWFLGVFAIAAALGGFGLFRAADLWLDTVRQAQFRHTRVRVTSPQWLQKILEVEADFEPGGPESGRSWVPAGRASGARRLGGEMPAWIGHSTKGMIAVVEEPVRVITAAGLALGDPQTLDP